jgi:hypothetical protein
VAAVLDETSGGVKDDSKEGTVDLSLAGAEGEGGQCRSPEGFDGLACSQSESAAAAALPCVRGSVLVMAAMRWSVPWYHPSYAFKYWFYQRRGLQPYFCVVAFEVLNGRDVTATALAAVLVELF